MAASKVNTKFVAILVGGLATVAVGGGGALYFFVANNADRLARLGQAAYESGDFEKAERLLSKAVNKQQTNPELLKKWIAAMERLTPATENGFRDKYGEYFAAHTALATRALQTDLAAHIAALELGHREVKDRFGDTAGNSDMVAAVDRSLGYFSGAKEGKHDVLRKYSGLALLRSYEAAANLKDAEIERARTDLEKAAAAAPDDGEAVTGLARWHDRAAFVLAQKQDVDAAKVEHEKAMQILGDFVKAHPDDVHGLFWDFLTFYSERERELGAITDREERRKRELQARDEALAKLDRFAAAIGRLEPAKIDAAMVARLSAMELRFSTEGAPRATGIYDRILTARPDDTGVLLAKATLLGESRKESQALDILQKLVDAPQKPVSYDGVMQFAHRNRGRYLQALYTMRIWEQEKEKAAKEKDKAAQDAAKASMDALLVKAKEHRTKLAEAQDADSAELLFIDSHLAISAGDYGQALKKLMEYNRKTRNGDTQGLWMAAQCAKVLGQDGTAESILKDILQRERAHLGANAALAELYATRLRQPDMALPYLGVILEIDPSNEWARTTKTNIEGRKTGLGVESPVSQALIKAEQFENQGKAAEAFELLKKAYKETSDILLVPPLAARMDKRGEHDAAVKLVEEALTKAPSDPRLRRIKIVLTVTDPLEQRIRTIEDSDVPEVDKLVAKVQVYRVFAADYAARGKADLATATRAKADECLKQAIQSAPNNTAVMEMQFLQALNAKDFATAERITQEAKKADLDLVGGSTFEARLLDAQGKLADAIRVLETARTKPTFNSNAGRILAEMMVRQRQVSDAVQVLREALEKRKTDRDALFQLAVLLVRLDQGQTALQELREKQEMHAADTEIQDLWLELEAMYGSKEIALAKQQQRLDIDPTNVKAKLAIAQLRIQIREFAGARVMIDELKATAAKDDVVGIEASWYAEQGDLGGAKKVFDDAIAAVEPGKVTPQMFLAKGQFMERIDQIREAIAAYQEAAKLQNPATLEADKALADLHLRQGDLPEAIELFKKIVAAKADEADARYAKKMIDAYLRREMGKEASEVLASMGDAVQSDPQLVLQQAEAIRLAGDEKKATEMVEQAVGKFPKNPLVYYRRANMNVKFPELRKDVVSDLEKAISLSPSFWQARRDLARIYVQDGKFDEATAQMRDAVKFNPAIDELRVQLVRDLLSQGRDADAAEVIETVIERRRDDVGLLLNSGDLMREARKNDSALNYYRRAYEISQQMPVVTRYIDLLQSANPPQMDTVDKILIKLKPVQDSEPALLMARAKQYIFRNKVEEGIKDMVASLRLVKANQPGLIMAWFGDIKRMLKEQKDVTTIIDIIEREKLIPGWTTFFKAGTLLEKEATESEGVALLEEMVKTVQDETLLRQAYLTLQAKYYQKTDCPNALRVMRASVEKFPNDAFVLNNLAYMMVRCGEDPAQAVPIAERAVRSMLAMNRSSPDILDTMGWVYVRAKMADKAGMPLQAALAEAGNTPIRATVLTHIAEYHILRGDKKNATAAADSAQQSIDRYPRDAKAIGQDTVLAEVRKQIEQMK